MDSSLKTCLVAEGLADIYPRLVPTSERDTAAHCILECTGDNLTTLSGTLLKYNTPNILPPWFLAAGTPNFNWTALAERLEQATGFCRCADLLMATQPG